LTQPGWHSIDETSANTKMVRLYGRCGERLVSHVQGHWKTITFVAALRRHGMRAHALAIETTKGGQFARPARTKICVVAIGFYFGTE
jgi:hypothetical protein